MSAKPQENLLPLKIVVISLGVLLVGGFVFVVASLLGRPHKTSCIDLDKPFTVNMPGKVDSIMQESGQWHITTHSNQATVLITVDSCTGKLVSTLVVKQPDAH